MQGRSVDEYRAPLFLAWQLTNRCSARCIACCEESGPDKAWRDELTRAEALDLARRIVDAGIPYVAFGGGEPLGVPHCWEIFELLAAAGVALKIETDGSRIDDAAADRIARAWRPVRADFGGRRDRGDARARAPGIELRRGDRARSSAWWRAACRRSSCSCPRGSTSHEIVARVRSRGRARLQRVRDRAADAHRTRGGRLGRHRVQRRRVAGARSRAARSTRKRASAAMELSIYPWDIVTEMETRLASPQAMLLVVPNGKVKLLNALPFAPADLRRDSLEEAWHAYREAWRSAERARRSSSAADATGPAAPRQRDVGAGSHVGPVRSA